MSELEPTLTSSNHIATERLRALLDGRGVEWRRTPHYSSESADNETVFLGRDIEWLAFDHLNGRLGLKPLRYEIEPGQVIAATLGDSDATAARQGDAVEVVRCRDCKFYTPESMTREERGFGVYENMWEPGGCFNPERCSHGGDPFGEWYVVGIDTEPDGFCAWASRKESE